MRGILLKNLRKYVILPLKKWHYNRKELAHLKKLLKSVDTKNILNKTIVINALRNFKTNFDAEVFYGLIFALHGAKVKILLDDGVLPHWDSTFYWMVKKGQKVGDIPHNLYRINLKDIKNLFKNILNYYIYKKSLKTYSHKNLEYIYYSKIINKNEINCQNLHELKKYAESSTIRFFRTTELDYKNEDVKDFYMLSLKTAALSRSVGEYVLNKIKPDIYLCMHGIYATHGPAYDFLKNNGIKSLVFGGANTYSRNYKDTIMLDTTTQTLMRSEYWNRYKKTPITDEMERKVKEFFDGRYSCAFVKIDTYSLMDKDKIAKVNKNDGYKYHICMFPNVIWDGNVRDRHTSFDGLVDWLVSTINHLKYRKDVKLYVKAHPSENYISVNADKIISLIQKHLNYERIENLEFIPPETRINTYELLKSGIDLALIYDGFLSVEIPYMGIPAVTCVDRGFVSGVGCNYMIKNKEEYFDYLDNIESLIDDFKKNYKNYYDTIVRFVYFFIFENGIQLPTFNKQYRTDLMQLTKRDLNFDKKFLNLF